MNNQMLEPMFSYSTTPIILVVGLIIALLFLIFKPKINKQEVYNNTPVIVRPPQRNLFTIKDKYQLELKRLRDEVTNETITTRKAYQKLSIIIRNFVYEVTSIKVQNYSLEEIKKLNMQSLTRLVEEYYKPEFAKDSNGFIKTSIEKTREVIEKWY